MGKALDIMIPDWAAPGGIALGNNIARWFVTNPAAFGTKLVIWRDQYNRGGGWRPYTHPLGPTKNPTLRHMDHVHVSVFDEGGWMQPGWGYNALKKPEPVFSPGQWDILKGAWAGEQAGGWSGMPSELVVVDSDGQLIGRMKVEARRVVHETVSTARGL